MPLKSLSGLPPKAKSLWERIYKKSRSKGYSEAKSSKIAWGVVKSNYVNKGGKWVEKNKTSKKSFPVHAIHSEKDFSGDVYLEGYILTYDVDEENSAYTREFAEDIFDDLSVGKYYHDIESKGVLEIIDKNIDDTGIWAKVKVNKDHPYKDKTMELIKSKHDSLAFSVEESTPVITGMSLEKIDGRYISVHKKGTGLGFGLTDVPVNKNAKAKVL